VAYPPEMKITLVERPELDETFVDSLEAFAFNNNLVRFDMCCVRLDPGNPPAPLTGRRYPVGRVVMPLDAAIELFNKLNHLFSALEKTGVIRREVTGSFSAPPGTTSH